MKKNNIEHTQLSPGFRRMCMAGFLLHAAAYMPFPLLAVGLGSEGVYFYLLMLAGLFLSGPFNAYLGDACYRKACLYGLLPFCWLHCLAIFMQTVWRNGEHWL